MTTRPRFNFRYRPDSYLNDEEKAVLELMRADKTEAVRAAGYQEKEIKVVIASFTARDFLSSVTSVVATVRSSSILYAIEDETWTDEEFPIECWPARSRKPLTFRQLVSLIDTAWHPGEQYRGCIGAGGSETLLDAMLSYAADPDNDYEGILGFFEFQSFFYPQFGDYYQLQEQDWLARNLGRRRTDDSVD